MKIGDKDFVVQDVSRVLTVPDCNVVFSNKIGNGHGEAKFYIGSKIELEQFIDNRETIECFFLKKDLLAYMEAVQSECENPSQRYNGGQNMISLWRERFAYVQSLPEIIRFHVHYQRQIQGPRGYINSNDDGYQLFRMLSLPLISYISIMRLQPPVGGPVFYWKLFVDFDAIENNRSVGQVLVYGGKNQVPLENSPSPESPSASSGGQQGSAVTVQPSCSGDSTRKVGRDVAAQAKYRQLLLDECPFCPITGISDERLLIASHIKPYAVSDENEKFDPKNGFMFSPLFDKLFDQGFITFNSDRCMVVSNWLSPRNQNFCHIKGGTFVQSLPLDDKRELYLQYHRNYVFKG